jgi:exodeoxyribonuclease VII small subunit
VNQTLSYEQARDELTEVVKRLEAGGLSLEDSLDLWERGERLAAICTEWLEGARARIATAMAQRTDAQPTDGHRSGQPAGQATPNGKRTEDSAPF